MVSTEYQILVHQCIQAPKQSQSNANRTVTSHSLWLWSFVWDLCHHEIHGWRWWWWRWPTLHNISLLLLACYVFEIVTRHCVKLH